MVETLVRVCRYATSLCDIDLIFDLAVVTLTFWKLILGWGNVGMLNHCVTFNLGSVKVSSSAMFETYFFYHTKMWIGATD